MAASNQSEMRCFSAIVGLEAFWSSLNFISNLSRNCLSVAFGGCFRIPARVVAAFAPCRAAVRYGFAEFPGLEATVVGGLVEGWVEGAEVEEGLLRFSFGLRELGFPSSVSRTCLRRLGRLSGLLLAGVGPSPFFFAFPNRALGLIGLFCAFGICFDGVVVLFLGFLVCRVVVVLGDDCRLCFSVLLAFSGGSVIVEVLAARCRCLTGYGGYGVD